MEQTQHNKKCSFQKEYEAFVCFYGEYALRVYQTMNFFVENSN